MSSPVGQSTLPPGAPPSEASNSLAGFFGRFAVLKDAPRELWLSFLIKFLSVAAYSVTNKTLVLWLSSDYGYSDQAAVGLVGVWALSMTGFTLVVGSLTDAIGLRKSFFLGVFICLVARTVMAFTNLKWPALAGGLFPLALGEALGTPVLIAATRRYSSTRQRSIAFSLLYTIMNLGFLAAGRLFDFVRQGLGEHGHMTLFGMQISSYRTLFLVSLAFELSLLPVVYYLRKGAEATDDGLRIVAEPAKYPDSGLWNSFWLTVRDSVRDTIQLFAGLLQQSGFYRLIAFLVFIGFLKVIVMQMDYVFPKFGIRELGDGAPIGQLSNINYILIVLLVPIIGALTQRFSAYRMVILGGAICASSVFIMALPTAWFQGPANGLLGHLVGHVYLGVKGSIHPYYVMIALYTVVFSVGEAFYSPRVYEYAAAIAPKGQEASYGALSYVPLFLGKLLVGSSGVVLAKYCPEHGERHSETMWLIFALVASVAPIGLISLRRFIRVHEVGRPD
jgi:MFS family permease